MKKTIHDIFGEKKSKEDFEHGLEELIRVYVGYGTLEMTFSTYTLMEQQMEESIYSEEKMEVLQQIRNSLMVLSEQDCDYAELRKEMHSLRETITEKMDFFTAYTDRMSNYEYVLNRIQYRFLPEKELSERIASFREEEYMQTLLMYLFGSGDKKVMQDRIYLLLEQIPARITKGKLFERIQETLTLYRGGDRSALDTFLYMIRTVSMIYEAKQCRGQYPGLEKAVAGLEQADYEKLSQEEYNDLMLLLKDGADELKNLTDFYYSAQKAVNGIYALCVVIPHLRKEESLEKLCRELWKKMAVSEMDEELLVPLEGYIEDLAEIFSYYNGIPDEMQSFCGNEIENFGMEEHFRDLCLASKLLSDSLFIDLNAEDGERNADEDYVRECTDKLLAELDEKMTRLSRPLKRAVTARILCKLPVPFHNPEEVREYISMNLLNCSDKAEKYKVMTLLSELMNEE